MHHAKKKKGVITIKAQVRTKLIDYEGETIKLEATVDQFRIGNGFSPCRYLLKNVYIQDGKTREYITDHLWMPSTLSVSRMIIDKAIDMAAGAKIIVEAEICKYRRGYNGKNKTKKEISPKGINFGIKRVVSIEPM